VKNIFLNSNNLTIGYGNEIVIKNLSLSLNSEKNYEIIGKNGSGKTTLSILFPITLKAIYLIL